jgi:hypothetical protein
MHLAAKAAHANREGREEREDLKADDGNVAPSSSPASQRQHNTTFFLPGLRALPALRGSNGPAALFAVQTENVC